MMDTAASLFADTGRPDTTELSRVIARKLVERLGGDVSGLGAPMMQPTRRTTATPHGAEELVPADIDGLREAARLLSELPAGDDALRQLADEAAAAHLDLAEAVSELRGHAEDVYERTGALGVGCELWTGSSVLRDRIEDHPEAAEELKAVARTGAELRLAWDGAQIDFIEDLAATRREFGIPSW